MDGSIHADAAADILVALDGSETGRIQRRDLEAALAEAGIAASDPRVRNTLANLADFAPADSLDAVQLSEVIHPSETRLVERALRGRLIIPDFKAFSAVIGDMFDAARRETGGSVADYIPQLARVAPDKYALSVCTIDGQAFHLGDASDAYCVQSTCKPINYAVALSLCGEATVHQHVGREPSGRSFNELTLNARGLPHNPMINAGAIMCSSLIHPDKSLADRFDYIAGIWRQLAGGRSVGFDNAVYHSEKDTAHRNFALAHFMMENGAFPERTNIHETLDFYFQCCSITVDAPAHAVAAATLANGGVCPLTNRRVFAPDVVKNCLSLMLSCGMYDFSGEFAFTVGLPAKSGVSGALVIVVPGLGGITVWSPPLDSLGNSVRGVAFSRALVERFPFHIYANLADAEHLEDPRSTTGASEADVNFALLWAAARGDVGEVRRLRAQGVDLSMADYDGRTALHLAASECQVQAAAYLLSRGAPADVKDRWGNTPLDDARRAGHEPMIALLTGQQPVDVRPLDPSGRPAHRVS